MSEDWAGCCDDIWQDIVAIYRRDYEPRRSIGTSISEHRPSPLMTFSWEKKPQMPVQLLTTSKEMDELEIYRGGGLADGNVDPLEWWKVRVKRTDVCLRC